VRLAGICSLLFAALVLPSTACTTRAATQNSYNYYQLRGNREAQNADFDEAIADWTQAEKLSPDPLKKCRGEFQRVQIRAATEARERMASRQLAKEQAAAWYQQRQMQLWGPDKCNRP
jgi:hypothetical protein